MNGKNTMRSKMIKIMTLVFAFVLVIGASVAGTLAWLTAETGAVENTFTSAKLFDKPEEEFTLWEHKAEIGSDGVYVLNGNEEVRGNAYKVLPGVKIPKNPTVDIVNLKECAYMYIKVTDNFTNGLIYDVDSTKWRSLEDGLYVYCGEQATNEIIIASDSNKKSFTVGILNNDEIVVPEGYASNNQDIKLTIEAYMVQATGNGTNAEDAWANTYGSTQQP